MQTEVSALTPRVTEPNFTAGSVKARVLDTVHKLGRSAYRSMIFAARLSTDETVATALEALVRDRFLTLGPCDIYALTDAGYSAIDIEPNEVSGKEYARSELKQCRNCRAFKHRDKDFGRANRSPDHRTADCNDCRGVTEPVAVAVVQPAAEQQGSIAATTDGAGLVEPPQAPSVPAPAILAIPTIMGVYVKIEGERVFINQPGQECQALTLNRERGLALGRFLCEHLGGEA